MPYEVLSDEYTVHRDIRQLVNKEGEVTGRQLGLGKTHFLGEVIPDAEVGQAFKDALEDKDNENHEYVSKHLKKVSGDAKVNTKQRLGVPFAGYDDMDEDSIVAAMKHLPSGVIQAIKTYEGDYGESRSKIVNYNIGYATDPDARQEGRVGSGAVAEDDARLEAMEEKATSKLVTRDVPEEGNVTLGEGVTGTGDGKRTNAEEKAEAKKVVRNRRGRRDRPAGEK